nr:MAG TPA: hypothetical protein [Caudoviricetes sp.]
MNAELAELIKEIGRIADTHEDNVEWYKIADFCKIMPIFEEPESNALNYHQYQLVVEIYAIAYSQCVNDPAEDWGTVKMFANMMLAIDRKEVVKQ